MKSRYVVVMSLICFFVLMICGNLSAEDITTAQEFLTKVSDVYASLYDYAASIRITKGDVVQNGFLMYSNRNLLKIEFSNPPGQIVLVDGEKLSIYVPRYGIILEQRYSASGANVASAKGLTLLLDNYMVAYAVKGTVPLDKDSNVMVTKLLLTPYSGSTEGFKQIILYIDSNYLIRRVEGTTVQMEKIVFDFYGIRLNVGIPLTKFDFDPPAMTNVYPDFLYDTIE
ncbi:MAG: outer membrane lipoprotein carrier protein LolA [Spirochaetales bacterium]|nr:outer membrane lipoprotein carrier protein LolA [Spirochaetales bacterium]